ncbi:uncharacterized protein LOC126811939 [Patella vulgata]|uniref:uncharacterized protein LOC126811939 n=1 Tax=Patella vulgata TaxID=6465 RepID=UPI0021807EDC|nr:uncharacterized protein LOC126811939 [Patella vulgata]
MDDEKSKLRDKEKQLANLKKLLAIKERKLERSLRANRVREHVRKKIKEQALISAREEERQNISLQSEKTHETSLSRKKPTNLKVSAQDSRSEKLYGCSIQGNVTLITNSVHKTKTSFPLRDEKSTPRHGQRTLDPSKEGKSSDKSVFNVKHSHRSPHKHVTPGNSQIPRKLIHSFTDSTSPLLKLSHITPLSNDKDTVKLRSKKSQTSHEKCLSADQIEVNNSCNSKTIINQSHSLLLNDSLSFTPTFNLETQGRQPNYPDGDSILGEHFNEVNHGRRFVDNPSVNSLSLSEKSDSVLGDKIFRHETSTSDELVLISQSKSSTKEAINQSKSKHDSEKRLKNCISNAVDRKSLKVKSQEKEKLIYESQDRKFDKSSKSLMEGEDQLPAHHYKKEKDNEDCSSQQRKVNHNKITLLKNQENISCNKEPPLELKTANESSFLNSSQEELSDTDSQKSVSILIDRNTNTPTNGSDNKTIEISSGDEDEEVKIKPQKPYWSTTNSDKNKDSKSSPIVKNLSTANFKSKIDTKNNFGQIAISKSEISPEKQFQCIVDVLNRSQSDSEFSLQAVSQDSLSNKPRHLQSMRTPLFCSKNPYTESHVEQQGITKMPSHKNENGCKQDTYSQNSTSLTETEDGDMLSLKRRKFKNRKRSFNRTSINSCDSSQESDMKRIKLEEKPKKRSLCVTSALQGDTLTRHPSKSESQNYLSSWEGMDGNTTDNKKRQENGATSISDNLENVINSKSQTRTISNSEVSDQKKSLKEIQSVQDSEVSEHVDSVDEIREERNLDEDKTISLKNNQSNKHNDRQFIEYSQFTELDIVEFSQFKFSEEFLSSQMSASSDGNPRKRRKSHLGKIIQRRSPRVFSASSSLISQLSEGYSEKSSRLTKKEKCLKISSVFQFLVDEVKRNKSESEFSLPENVFMKFIAIKNSERASAEPKTKNLEDFDSVGRVSQMKASSGFINSESKSELKEPQETTVKTCKSGNVQAFNSKVSPTSFLDVDVVYDSEPIIEDDSLSEPKCYHRHDAMESQDFDVSVISETENDKSVVSDVKKSKKSVNVNSFETKHNLGNISMESGKIDVSVISESDTDKPIVENIDDNMQYPKALKNENPLEKTPLFKKNTSLKTIMSDVDKVTTDINPVYLRNGVQNVSKVISDSSEMVDEINNEKRLLSEKIEDTSNDFIEFNCNNLDEVSEENTRTGNNQALNVGNSVATPKISDLKNRKKSLISHLNCATSTPKVSNISTLESDPFTTPKDANFRKCFNFPNDEGTPPLFKSQKETTPIKDSLGVEKLLDDSVLSIDTPIRSDDTCDNKNIEPIECIKLCRREPVVYINSGRWIMNGEEQQYIISILPSAISLWTKGDGDWENELDWFLSCSYQATNGWCIKKQNKVVMVIMEEDKEGDQRLSLFFYDLTSGESNMSPIKLKQDLDCPVTSLLCCILETDEVIIGFNHPTTHSADKYFLIDGFKQLTVCCHLESNTGYLLDVQQVLHIDACVVGLTADREAVIWNHEEGFILKKINLSCVLSPGVSLTSLQNIQGYLLFHLMNRVKNSSPGYLMIVNPINDICLILQDYQSLQYSWKGLNSVDTLADMQIAVDIHGNTGLWDMSSGELLASLLRSDVTSTSICQSNQTLLYLGLKTGVIHIYSIFCSDVL